MGHALTNKLWARRKIVVAWVCVLWLALGGYGPAQAATPSIELIAAELQPTRLIIPSLEIDAPVESVGQTEEHRMGIPSGVEEVAWYNLGPQPGEPGNAVMAGHLDDVRGRPAVFWRLDELQPGDEILVRYSDEHEVRFAVTSVEAYDADSAPMERIFGVDFERDLNLITCDGEWNAQNKLYEKRLVVYARRIREEIDEEVEVEELDEPAQARPASSISAPPSPRPIHARQNRKQSPATH
jgi:LPXTG-site transpeptidase (sortase) family protein